MEFSCDTYAYKYRFFHRHHRRVFSAQQYSCVVKYNIVFLIQGVSLNTPTTVRKFLLVLQIKNQTNVLYRKKT